MKRLAFLLPLLVALSSFASSDSSQVDTSAFQKQLETTQAKLQWKTGKITLPGGKAEINLPTGYRYLAPSDAQIVLEELWGNPDGKNTLGMIFGPGQEPLTKGGWGAILSYDDDGHIDDEDAAKTDFNELLEDMKKSSEENNEERVKQGYEKVQLLGWAEAPHYDAAAHKIYWAKNLKFEGNEGNTLNYFVRVLGREGVLEINAVSDMEALAQVKEGMNALNAAATFTAGNRYADFNKDTDKMSELGLAALVTGGAAVAVKTGFFKGLLLMLLAAKKFVVIALLGLVAGIKAWWGSRQKKAEDERFGRG